MSTAHETSNTLAELHGMGAEFRAGLGEGWVDTGGVNNLQSTIEAKLLA
jgi:hypothetical protein